MQFTGNHDSSRRVSHGALAQSEARVDVEAGTFYDDGKAWANPSWSAQDGKPKVIS